MRSKLYSAEDFIQDECFQQWVFSPDDASNLYWESFLLSYPEQHKNVAEAREFLQMMKFGRPVPESLIQKIKSAFNAEIDRLEYEKSRMATHGSRYKSERILYLVAASVFLVLFAGYFMLPGNWSRNLIQPFVMEVQRNDGQQRHIVLDDGTHVWLNAKTALKYPKHFSKNGIREVFLEGEAFFDVAENPDKPFIVRVSGIAVKVLGTAFNVRSYEGDDIVETTLVRGKITIASHAEDTASVTLLPDQQALFSKQSQRIELKKTTNTENHIAWKDGWIIFENKPFSYIKQTLERWYDVTITVGDERSSGCSFSGKFRDKTLLEVLEIFRTTEAIDYRIEGNRVLIDGPLCGYEHSNQ